MTNDFTGEQIFEHLSDGRFYCLLNNGSDQDPSIQVILDHRYEGMMSRTPGERTSSTMAILQEEAATADARL